MIEHEEALELISSHTECLGVERVSLQEAYGRVLAEDVHSTLDIPFFDNSAVDGYVLGKPNDQEEKWRVVGEQKAGDSVNRELKSNEALRIFTGAKVPEGAWSVQMQENSSCVEDFVKLSNAPVMGANIRRKGEDIRSGQRVLEKGVVLEAQHIGLLAAVGCDDISVYKKPLVSILSTGSELVDPGQPLKEGEIYDSNTLMLDALVRHAKANPHRVGKESDQKESLTQKVIMALRGDVLMVSGGVSVGKYDYIKDIFRELGVKEVFWKIKIKPGKPLYFGTYGKKLIFGLPGNPVSAFVTFHTYVKPALLKLQGYNKTRQVHEKVLMNNFQNGSRRNFVRVRFHEQGRVEALQGQGSHMIGSLAQADAIMQVEPDTHLGEGQTVKVQKIVEGS